MVEYIPSGIFRASFKVCMGEKLRKEMEGGKRDETFFSALVESCVVVGTFDRLFPASFFYKTP